MKGRGKKGEQAGKGPRWPGGECTVFRTGWQGQRTDLNSCGGTASQVGVNVADEMSKR